MDAYLLRYFLAVVDAGSFTKAADACYVTQPSLSAGIKKLEENVGVQLFERTSRRVFLTEAGVRFLPRARNILQEINLAKEAISEDHRSVFRLGILSTIPGRLASRLIGSFGSENPDILIEVIDGTEQELLNRLEERRIHIAITIDRGYLVSRVTELFEEPYKLILKKGHALASQGRVDPTDLMQEQMIVRARCELLPETSRFFTDNNLRPRLVYRTSNDSRAVAMVAAGIGGTIAPDSAVDASVAALDLAGFQHKRRVIVLRGETSFTPEMETVMDRFTEAAIQQLT